ncbi:putative oxysterol binding protein [Phyllosticta citribraziliensis]
MVLGHARRHSLSSNRSSTEDARDNSTVTPEDETVVDSEQSNVLTHIISQLRPGADLSRITLPTFILEPRSMLERITNFMAHPETLLPMPTIQDPTERFLSVVKFYLSGWHIKPPYFFMAPEHHIRIDGTLKPRSKFLGNSAASMMEGLAVMRFLNHNERYFITQPNMYARGILFGKMKYELGDHSFVRCPELGLEADIEFKTKGWVSGTYNAIGGYIRDAKTGHNLYELSGLWTGEMWAKNIQTGKRQLLFDASHARETPPRVRSLEEQDERESQRLWQKVTTAIKQRDQLTATDEKTKIEDRQREEAARRADEGHDWTPRLFRRVQGGPGGPEEGEEDLDFIIRATIDGATPEEQTKQILNIAPILPGQKPPQRRLSIPEHNNNNSESDHRQSTSTVPSAAAHDDPIDFGQHDAAANKNGRPHGTIVRKDSDAGSLEEFVDAES